MSKLSRLAYRVNGFKGSLTFIIACTYHMPNCASYKSYELRNEIHRLAMKLKLQISEDYLVMKKKIKAETNL